MIICKFSRGIYHKQFDDAANLYTLVTGIEMSGEEMKRSGERISNIARLFNTREGFTRKDDHLPVKVMTTPIPDEGVAKGSCITQDELDELLDDYYKVRGWSESGIPTTDKLRELSLEDYAHIVEPLGG